MPAWRVMSAKTTGVVGACAGHKPTIMKLIATCRNKRPREGATLAELSSTSAARALFSALDRRPAQNNRFKAPSTSAAIRFIKGKVPWTAGRALGDHHITGIRLLEIL